MTGRRPLGRAMPGPGDGQGNGTPAVLTEILFDIEADARLDAWALRLQRLGGTLDTGQIGRILEGRWLGHALHPLLTDLPLGCWLSAGILDLVGGRPAAPAAQRLVGAGLLAVREPWPPGCWTPRGSRTDAPSGCPSFTPPATCSWPPATCAHGTHAATAATAWARSGACWPASWPSPPDTWAATCRFARGAGVERRGLPNEDGGN